MRFLLHIPGDHKGTAEEVMASVGLGSIARGIDVQKTDKGPAGHGLQIAWLSNDQSDMRYLPDQQTWMPSLNAGQYWVGIWNDSPPAEHDLRRPDHRGGVNINFNDSGTWAIPTPDTLERYPHPDPDNPGQILWSVDEQFNWLVADLDKIVAERVTTLEDETYITYDRDQDFDFFCRLLQINYRITPEVIMHLRLMSDVSVGDMMRALVRNRLGASS